MIVFYRKLATPRILNSLVEFWCRGIYTCCLCKFAFKIVQNIEGMTVKAINAKFQILKHIKVNTSIVRIGFFPCRHGIYQTFHGWIKHCKQSISTHISTTTLSVARTPLIHRYFVATQTAVRST